MKNDELIPLYTAKDNLEAAMIADVLETNGIAAVMQDESSMGVLNLYGGFSKAGIFIYVTKENYERTFRRYGILRKKETTEKKTEKNIKMKIARMEKNLSQIQLAERVGVTRQTIGMIEAGDFNPSLKLCIAICKELDCTLNDLFWEE